MPSAAAAGAKNQGGSIWMSERPQTHPAQYSNAAGRLGLDCAHEKFEIAENRPRRVASCCIEMYAHDTGMLDVVPK